MTKVNNHSVEQAIYSLFPKRLLMAIPDHEKLTLEVLDNEAKNWAFALVILKMLAAAWGNATAALSPHFLARRYLLRRLDIRRQWQKA